MMGFNAAPAKDKKIQSVTLPNYGLLQSKLEDNFVEYLWSIIHIAKQNQIPNPYEGGNKNLKGLPLSIKLNDKEDWFSKILPNYVTQYKTSFGEPFEIEHDFEFMLNDDWVNFQKQNEFNPAHCHGGIYSFVIWLKCPSPATFQFTYPNTLGGLNHLSYNTDTSYENMMILFPAQLLHQVYPFYNSDEERVSISGNIGIRQK